MTGILNPQQMSHLLLEEEYERLLRLHQVRVKLGLSAPQKSSLGSDLALAREHLVDKADKEREIKRIEHEYEKLRRRSNISSACI
jgi:hypothetical protein